jgi:hypothetical protein
VSIQVTRDQVVALAPDVSAASAGKKLGNTTFWKNLGQNERAMWGECQGSALYQIKIDLSTLTTQCSCPSRKLPCKHSLGLLFIAATDVSSIPDGEPPEWVEIWLTKRQARTPRTSAKDTSPSKTSSSRAAQAKRVEKRQVLISRGLDSLDLWMNDLVRNGLASIQTRTASFWESQAAQMTDAQAPGVAARLRRMATIPNASRDWPEKLLAQLGLLALLTHSYRQLERVNTALQEDIRQMIGWNLGQEEVTARGESVRDDWLILGQVFDDEERVRVQYTWLHGVNTKREALILQFSVAGATFPEVLPLGSCQQAELLFWPSAYQQRARINARHGAIVPIQESLPGEAEIEAFLASFANALAQQPWLDRGLCLLQGIVPLYCGGETGWYVRDRRGSALPLAQGDHWQLLALSGGYPVDLASVWDGERLLPLGVMVQSSYYLLGRNV